MNLTRTQKRLIFGAVAGIGFAYVLGLFEFAPSFLTCVQNQADATNQTGNHKLPVTGLSIPIVALIHGRCGFKILYEYRDGIVTIATVLLAVFTWTLWGATRDLVEGAEDTAKRQLRAYIAVAIEEHPAILEGIAPTARIVARNCGQTPAYDLTMWAVINLLTWPHAEEFPYRPDRDPAKTIVDPGTEHRFVTQRGNAQGKPDPLTTQEAFLIKDGSVVRLHVWGEVKFRDAFNRIHTREFWFEMGGFESMRENKMFICGEGNRET